MTAPRNPMIPADDDFFDRVDAGAGVDPTRYTAPTPDAGHPMPYGAPTMRPMLLPTIKRKPIDCSISYGATGADTKTSNSLYNVDPAVAVAMLRAIADTIESSPDYLEPPPIAVDFGEPVPPLVPVPEPIDFAPPPEPVDAAPVPLDERVRPPGPLDESALDPSPTPSGEADAAPTPATGNDE
jgi:hypothetical protein